MFRTDMRASYMVCFVQKCGSFQGFSIVFLAGKVIVIDPGHGGYDPGAVSWWRDKEKDFTFDIAFKTVQYLRYHGARVIMTRYGDYPPGSDWGWYIDELVARVSIANSNNADVFLSIHVNAYPKIQKYLG